MCWNKNKTKHEKQPTDARIDKDSLKNYLFIWIWVQYFQFNAFQNIDKSDLS